MPRVRDSLSMLLLATATATATATASSACVSEPPEARTPTPLTEKTAEVCVIRESRQAARTSMILRDNGRLVGATRGSSYVCWLAAPGEHQLVSVDDDTGPILFHASAGGRYFLHQEISELPGAGRACEACDVSRGPGGEPPGLAVHAHLDWVTERDAERLIEQCDDRVVARVSTANGQDDAMAVAPAVSRR